MSCLVQVDYYGAPTPIRQLAGISVPESSMLVIQPYDKGSMQAIEKAIQMSDLGLPPNNDGKLIRLNIPPLTQVRFGNAFLLLRVDKLCSKSSVENSCSHKMQQ